MANLRNLQSREIIESISNTEKMRSVHEITARYNLKRQQYHDLKLQSDGKAETREQLAMLYAEAKVLAWTLGKNEKVFLKDITY